ncbi:MAG: leucine-rich repeat domain-containing protein, partial [Candidatus Hermodarchaeota archaeon]
MSVERPPPCDACGLPLKEPISTDEKNYQLCVRCTEEGSNEPIFEAVVYGIALGYFLGKRRMNNPQEALIKAQEFVRQLPFWREKELLVPTLGRVTTLTADMTDLQYDEASLTAPDFFVSYSWTGCESKDEESKELYQKTVEGLVQALKDRGYRVWIDKDTWENEAGKTTDWMKRGIKQARHCIIVLCPEYFESSNCQFELKTILTTKNATNVFPIWWEGLKSQWIRQLVYGEQLLEIMGIGWTEWQGNELILLRKLLKRVKSAEGFQDYQGISLMAAEARVLEELERIIEEPLPQLDTIPSYSTKQQGKETFFGFYVEKNQIVGLFLEGKNLRYLPRILHQCSALQILHLSKNPGINIPIWLSDLSSLRRLNLAENQLTFIPETLGRLRKLRELDLSKNRLYSLPESMGDLRTLVHLELRHNELTSLPDMFFQLTGLQILNLEYNTLRSLPESIGNLVNLQELHLGDNKLSSLPASFFQLHNLHTLSLGDNEFISLPESIKGLEKLQ